MVQEALTNALKHAGPGADVETTVAVDDDRLLVDVANSRTGRPAPLPCRSPATAWPACASGSRSSAAPLAAGPTGTGGWRLCVTLPLGARS